MKSIRALVAVFVVVTALSSTGCEILFWLALDPQGLPCRAQTPQCLDGYFCDTDNICKHAAAQLEGEICLADEECEDGLVCRNHYAAQECEAFDYDLNCLVARQREQSDGLRCRRECNPNQSANGQCGAGQTCYSDERNEAAEGGYCQPGACFDDAHCGNGAVCIGEQENPDPDAVLGSGRCFIACDPFGCFEQNASCAGCPIEDTDGDDVDELQGCEPSEGDLTQTVCFPGGTNPHRAPCSLVDPCAPGSFCATDIGTCVPYCNFASPGAEPACNVGEECSQLGPGDNRGYCRP